MKKTKTIVIPVIGGKRRRIYKSEISCVEEQLYIDGSIDVEVLMKSGHYYTTTLSKKTIEERIGNER